MTEKPPSQEEQLFVYLVSMFSESTWIALGKIKNPATDKLERNLDGASLYIDLLDMIKNRTAGNLSDSEKSFLDSTISNLKLNYMEEVKAAEKLSKETEEKPETEETIQKKDDETEEDVTDRKGD